VGTPIAGRNRTELEGLIGFFVNTMVMRTDLSGQPSFRELLGRVRETALGAFAHQDMPFEKLVEELSPQRDLSRTPLFQVFFNHMVARGDKAMELPGIETVAVGGLDQESQFDISLTVLEGEGGLAARFEYNTDLFDAGRIERMVGHLQTLLEGIVADPEKCIYDLPILDEAERRQLLVEWNDTVIDYPRNKCISELFEDQVNLTPDAIAVADKDKRITYQELNTRSNQLAHYLKEFGAGPQVVVGLCIKRSIEMVTGIMGIFKARGIYMPLDPSYPEQRLSFMLEDSCAQILLTDKNAESILPKSKAKIICLESDDWISARYSPEDPVGCAEDETPAYLIYTSGSTGRPKGVIGLQRGLVNRFNWMWKTYPFAAGEICCQKTSINFVDSMWEILGPLLQGIKTVIISDEVVKDPRLFVKNLADEQVTRIIAVPSYLRAILDADPDLQVILAKLKFWISSGEILSKELYQRFYEKFPQSLLLNLYGSSEVSADVTCYESNSMSAIPQSVPIGRPIANTQVYILDPNLQPVPVGVPGELYVGGENLAAGYLKQDKTTENSFIPNPFSDKPDSRLFKTGDNGRWLADGNIEFIERADQQVKIRGFRIELGEVETVLSQHPGVRQAAVTAREDLPDEKRIVAYYVQSRKQTPTIAELRRYLRQKLPDYMVPSAFVLLDALPLMPNGKVDRRALPAPDKVRQEPAESSDKPLDEIELQLTKIWEKVLGIKNVKMKENFFDLGGHSLLAVRLFAQIHKIFGKDLPLTTLFQAPTVEQLAGVLRQKGWSSPWSSLVPIQLSGSRPPFFCVHGCGGIVFHMQGFARHLFPEQPFYGLKAQGLEEGQTPHTRIEDMAAFYIKEIQTVQPDGPYYIGSTGYGGAVVLEIAQQLKSQGQNVVFLALINAVALHPYLSNYSFIRSIYGGSFEYFFHRLVDFMRNKPLLPYIKYTFFNRVLVNWNISRRFVPMDIQREYRFREVFTNALLNYTPHVYPGRITCIMREKISDNPQGSVRDWYDIAGSGLDFRFVPGTFEDIWRGREPYARILAEQLKACLEETQTNSEGFTDTKN
jgi:aspartate racemase